MFTLSRNNLITLRRALIALLHALDDALGYERTVDCRKERRDDKNKQLTNGV